MEQPSIKIKAWKPPTTLGQRVGVIHTITIYDNSDYMPEAHFQFYNKNLGEIQLSTYEAKKLRDFLIKSLGE